MRTHTWSRASALRRYTLPVVVAVTAAALTAGLVPAQAAVAAPRAGAEDEYPPPNGPGDLRSDPEIQKIVGDAQYAVKYSFAVAAADPTKPFPQGSIEEDLRKGVLAMPVDRQKLAGEEARALLASPDRRKAELGRYSAYSPDRYRDLGFAGTFTGEAINVDKDALNNRLQASALELEKKDKANEAAAMRMADVYKIPLAYRIPTVKSLDLRIDKVKCVDETNPEPFGGDEIAMGGVKVHSDGTTTKVSQFLVGSGFDDGDSVTYSAPGKLFSRFDMTDSGSWPRTYSSVVMLAEKDGSGFSDAITTVWEKVKDKVKVAIEGFVTGVLTPYLGAAIANAIGKAVAWLIAVFFDWLFAFFQDDLFDPGYVALTLPNRYEWMYKNPADLGFTNFSGWPGTFTFNGHGGSYKVNIHYQVNP